MISKTRTILVGMYLALICKTVFAAERINVVTTIPDLAWMAKEIGGEWVETKALLKGTENPHFVDAVPNYIKLVADAKIVCLVGLELEVGYMPPVLAKSGNKDVQPTGPGYCEVGKSVTALDKPTGPIDRSMGDVHPSGNPHFWLSPKSMSEGAQELVKVLTRVDPRHAADFEKNYFAFKKQMETLNQEISLKLEPFRNAADGKAILIEYHKEFAYFLELYAIKSFGSIEEKPGVPPSAGRLLEISKSAKAAGVRVALAADYNPEKTLNRFREISDISKVIVPTMIQPNGSYKTYPELQHHIADSLVKAIAEPSPKK